MQPITNPKSVNRDFYTWCVRWRYRNKMDKPKVGKKMQ